MEQNRTICWVMVSLLLILSLSSCAAGQPQARAETASPEITPLPQSLTVEATDAPATPASPGDGFDRRAMLTTIIEESVLPLHRQFVSEAEALAQAAAAFEAAPTVETLAELQEQWRTTAEAWAAAEHLGFRFTMTLHTPIKKWPINTSFIEKFITEETDPIDEPFIESIGSTSKGLTAIEYLIFSAPATETVAQLTTEPRRLAYLVALTENLARKARELEALWLPEGKNQAQAFIEADFSGNDVQGSLNMLVNELIAALETTANTRLNYPRKGTYGTPQPEAVESPYAQFSGPLIGANLRGVQQTFNAGLAGYLDFLQPDHGGEPLSATINAQFEQAVRAVEAISPSLQVAVTDDPATVEQAYNEVRALLVLFKVDLANQLGVTVTFSDNDGD